MKQSFETEKAVTGRNRNTQTVSIIWGPAFPAGNAGGVLGTRIYMISYFRILHKILSYSIILSKINIRKYVYLAYFK